MILGIGTDILHMKTIEPSVRDSGSPFVRSIYTENERELILSRPDPLSCFCTRFAGKEAVFKAFGVHGDSFRLNDIEILAGEFDEPYVILHGKAKALADEKGVTRVLISLSYDNEMVAAFAVLE